MRILLTIAALALASTSATAATLTPIDTPDLTGMERMTLTADMFTLAAPYGRPDLQYGDPASVIIHAKAYDGREGVESGTYATNNNAQMMTFNSTLGDFLLRITDANDQPRQSGFTISAGGSVLYDFGDRRPNGNVQWFEVRSVSGSLLFDTTIRGDGYSVETWQAVTTPAPVPLPAAGLLLACALGGLSLMLKRQPA